MTTYMTAEVCHNCSSHAGVDKDTANANRFENIWQVARTEVDMKICRRCKVRKRFWWFIRERKA